MLTRTLLALLAASSAAPTHNYTDCSLLQQEWARNNTGRGPPAALLALQWGSRPARAAAALLRAALLAAGHAPARVLLARAPPDLCAAAAAPRAAGAVTLAPAAAWRRGLDCDWSGAGLVAEGAGAAPLAAVLHVRLGCAARALCLRADWSAADYARAARYCSFLAEGESAAPAYAPDDDPAAAAALRERLGDSTPFRVELVPWANLSRLVRDGRRSFLFADAELWEGAERVLPVREPPLDAAVSVRMWDRERMLRHAQAAGLAFREFSPRPRWLREVLELEAAGAPAAEAACRWARAHPAEIAPWRARARQLYRQWVSVVGCEGAVGSEAYESLVKDAEKFINDHLDADDLNIKFEWTSIDCGDRDRFARWIFASTSRGDLAHLVGAALPAEMAAAGGWAVEVNGRPTVSYDVASAGVRSTGGGGAALAAALSRLLAACGWRRAAVLQAPGAADAELAAALAEAVAARGGRALLRALPSEPGALDATLEELRARDVRIFVVAGGAEAAARVLARAAALRLTRARGRVWLVRELAAGGAARGTRPLSVAAAWRGGALPPRAAPPPAHVRRLRAALAARWPAGAWPPLAAPLADAMLTLAEGHRRLVESHPDTLRDAFRKDRLKLFWEQIRKTNISGIVHDLHFDEDGEVDPFIYVEEWDESERPRRLATWRGPGGRARCPLPAPPDGAVSCALPAPYGDAFDPPCLDFLPYVAFFAFSAIAALYLIAKTTLRRKLESHERRAQKKFFERMVARYPGAYAALEARLVDRAALRARRELGAGRFGRVWLCELRGAREPVAAKALRDGAAPAEEADFMREAATLAALRHPHIVRFVGVCACDGPPLLLMEYAFFGDLRRYLRARRHLATAGAAGEEAAHVAAPALTRLAREAAAALAHLAACRVVHRDVRAVNCLLDARRSLKLADFGMARATDAADGEYACRRRALFPVLWMAPETLASGVSTAASDVWALGVLALELVTLGARPWGERPLREAVRAVRAGGRPPLPRDAAAGARALTAACWRRAPAERPSAAALAAWLARRPCALRPALAPPPDDLDADSGFGEPHADAADCGSRSTDGVRCDTLPGQP